MKKKLSSLIWPVKCHKIQHSNGYIERILILFSIKTQRGHDTLYYISFKGERQTIRIDGISIQDMDGNFIPLYKILKEYPPAVVIGDQDDWDLFKNRNMRDMDFRAFPIAELIRVNGMDSTLEKLGHEVTIQGHGTTWKIKNH